MPEGILVRDKINKALPAVGIQFTDIFRRQAVKIRRLLGIGGLFEAVALHVQLKFVVFQRHQKIDHRLDGFNLGHATAADVQHVAAALDVRLVGNFGILHLAASPLCKLKKRSRRSEQGFCASENPAMFFPSS